MVLPADGSQDRLISAVAAVNPNVIVVNSTGSPIEMPWLSEVSAVVQVWFGGQEAGNSIVDVLFGVANPSGKLPVSFPKSDKFSASYGNFPGDSNDQVYYKEGVKVGYRHFDDIPDKVLFPFGFGLSYTTFEISEVKVEASEKLFRVIASVHNTGEVEGSEVVQVYVSSPVKTVDMPVKEMVGYAKVNVKADERQSVEIEGGAAKLAYWDEQSNKWVVEKGEYAVLVGNSSTSVSKAGSFTVKETWTFDP
jgi:beta-glucosidase